MSEAYASTLNISFDVRGGLLMRQIHHWAADVFMAAIMAHMLRIFFTGAYRKPREFNWLIGIVLFTLGMLEGLFGYSLPDDLLSGAGLRILEGVIQSLPIVGTYLAFFLFGGQFPGDVIIPRMYIIHVLLIPGLLLALITAHLFFMFHQKHTQMPGKGHTDRNVVGQPLYPYFMAKTGAFFFFTFGVLALLATFAQINPIWLYGPYNPVAISSGTHWPGTCSFPGSSRSACSSPVRPSGRSSNAGSPATSVSTTSMTGPATRRPGPRSASRWWRATACSGWRARTTSLPTTSTSRSTPRP
jgi:ubiquinol-cytochrome c reductase cytochrome b subunit